MHAAEVVVCATSARSPLFDAELIADTAVVVAVGSHEPDARGARRDVHRPRCDGRGPLREGRGTG